MNADVMDKIAQEVGEVGPLYGHRDKPHPLVSGRLPEEELRHAPSFRNMLSRLRGALPRFGGKEEPTRQAPVGALAGLRKARTGEKAPRGRGAAQIQQVLSDVHTGDPELAQKARQEILGGFGPRRAGPAREEHLRREKWQAVRNAFFPSESVSPQDARHIALNALRSGIPEGSSTQMRRRFPHLWEIQRVFGRIRQTNPELADQMSNALSGKALQQPIAPGAPFDVSNPLHAFAGQFAQRAGQQSMKRAGLLAQYGGGTPPAPKPTPAPAPAAKKTMPELIRGPSLQPKAPPSVPGLPAKTPAPRALATTFAPSPAGAQRFRETTMAARPTLEAGIGGAAARAVGDPRAATRREVTSRLMQGMQSLPGHHAEWNHNVRTAHAAHNDASTDPGTLYMHRNATSMFGVPREHLQEAGFKIVDHDHGPHMMHEEAAGRVAPKGVKGKVQASHAPARSADSVDALGSADNPGHAVSAYWDHIGQDPAIRSRRAAPARTPDEQAQQQHDQVEYVRAQAKNSLKALDSFAVNQGESIDPQHPTAWRMLGPAAGATLSGLYVKHGLGSQSFDPDRAHSQLRSVLEHFANLPSA